MEKFFAIEFARLNDGTIRLKQECGIDGPSVVDLHLEQVKFIARRLCGFKEEDAQLVEELERRLAVLADKIQNLACASWVRNELLERDTEGDLILARLDALADLALEFDGGRLKPEYPDDTTQQPACPPCGVEETAKADSARSGGIPAGQLDLIEDEAIRHADGEER